VGVDRRTHHEWSSAAFTKARTFFAPVAALLITAPP
jgi:hypothetical protein